MKPANEYIKALNIDQGTTEAYYRKSLLIKTEQQKFLEALLQQDGLAPKSIADIACGGGGVSYHLGTLFPNAEFTLIDLNPDAIRLAKETTGHLNVTYRIDDIYGLDIDDERFDLVVCWQTLSWLDDPERALCELVRICKLGGKIYLSSLFNQEADVDIYARVIDHTRPSSAKGLSVSYNTYSMCSMNKWLAGRASQFTLHNFEIPVDLEYKGRGMGTYTVRTDASTRLQISGGLLMNWGILKITK